MDGRYRIEQNRTRTKGKIMTRKVVDGISDWYSVLVGLLFCSEGRRRIKRALLLFESEKKRRTWFKNGNDVCSVRKKRGSCSVFFVILSVSFWKNVLRTHIRHLDPLGVISVTFCGSVDFLLTFLPSLLLELFYRTEPRFVHFKRTLFRHPILLVCGPHL